MQASPELTFLTAVLARLRATSVVNNAVRGRIFDDVPDEGDRKPPWIHAGPMNAQRVEMGCSAAWDLRLRLYVESAAFDRDEAWTIARAAMRALEGQEPPAADGFTDRLTIRQSGDVIDPLAVKSVFFDVATRLIDV
ncbi:DUF3168 domain-containing protein [Methylobacterium nodulans]|uniref:DUF3168 domain-containing protein n=1 Tax=Methylobacterium nodulans (strain LMG 21967 / CNCM I-2342 / ORS 2060) TaxID=460265 RepID=B8ILT5_METNO|nr:DUF3168 domain-containing protein [Methylobacterium nodulans]ACL62060.1 hypothetical protein Mnod_7321 [Methylobacterium nodulans ORS 2060]